MQPEVGLAIRVGEKHLLPAVAPLGKYDEVRGQKRFVLNAASLKDTALDRPIKGVPLLFHSKPAMKHRRAIFDYIECFYN